MTSFRFRLESLLELRVEAEALAAGRLAEARRDAEEARRTHDAVETARATAREKLSQLQAAGSDAGRLLSIHLVLDRVQSGVDRARELVATAHHRLSQRRDDYQRANRERRALEELKVKRRGDWSRDAERTDQRTMDEVAVIRYARRARSLSPGGDI